MYRILLIISLWSATADAQIKWDGDAGDGLWNSPSNWSGDQVPSPDGQASIILDNSIVAEDYTVRIRLQDSIVLRSLVVSPSEGRQITLWIDSSSIISPALSLTGTEGMVLQKGARLINSSGAASGTVISLSDSFRIDNEAIYIHQTRRAHAGLVSRLSRSPGTETGIFCFDIPSASNTLSLSNQVYGTLRLSSDAYNNTISYSGAAANPLLIRGHLEIGERVQFSLNFSDTVFIRQHYRQQGGIFNLANANRAAIVLLEGDLDQQAGLITKTGTANPQLLIGGNHHQSIRASGALSGAFTIKMYNPAGATLVSPLVIPYRLELAKGRIFTSAAHLLTISDTGWILADSSLHASFIHGPLRKTGLHQEDHFLFPVGKDATQRWLSLKNASGSFTAEFFRVNPAVFSTTMGAGIHHISTMEYWKLSAEEQPPPEAKLELSYNEYSSGGITDLLLMRIAGLSGEIWQNAGNSGITGSAGASGSVISNSMLFPSGETIFTLASSSAVENPLWLRTVPRNVPPATPSFTGITISKVQALSPGLMQVILTADESSIIWLELSDVQGKKLYYRYHQLSSGINKVMIQGLPVAAGIYMLRVLSPGHSGKPALNSLYRFLILR